MQPGFIGLGSLGNIMVQNLLERGQDLHIYNRSAEKMEPFQSKATLHYQIASIASACDIIFSIVSDDAALEAICFSGDGLIANMKPGSLHVCISYGFCFNHERHRTGTSC